MMDFWEEFRRPNPYRWPILGVSVLITTSLLFIFAGERVYGEPVPPDVTYITTFEPGRSEEEIIASNIENQKTQDALRALEEEQAEYRKELYRQLGRATGVDVDAMEAEIAAEQAAETAAAKAANSASGAVE